MADVADASNATGGAASTTTRKRWRQHGREGRTGLDGSYRNTAPGVPLMRPSAHCCAARRSCAEGAGEGAGEEKGEGAVQAAKGAGT